MESLLILILLDAYLLLIGWIQAHPIRMQILVLNFILNNHKSALIIMSSLQDTAIIGTTRIRIDGIICRLLRGWSHVSTWTIIHL